ncbi:Aldo/keto reductase [Pleurostoma richardsiae]|uniref:Aldo/keto reductase n=1 Tax=Pleurostoma richardsiae TaxID=41990 RepID=A0AA38RL38_9PEZI|nr:Aldo/keto reductase [Pleurostoma richardsiae]
MQAVTKTRFPIVFGAMTIGKPGVEQTRIHNLSDAAAVLDIFQKHGHNEVDTARVYGQGSSEEYLGQLDWQARNIVMETKYYPSSSYGQGGTHNPEDLRKHLLASLRALKTDKIDMWYLHGPDRTTPYEATFRAIDELHKEGYFNRLGISNYMAWEVAYINEICIRNGWLRPTVYQGVYNAIHRSVELELFPCLRHYGMAFYAYNPLAGGYLTSRYHRGEQKVEEGSRFDPKTRQGTLYKARYWKEPMFDALDIIREAAGKHGLTEVECALRWMMHHSKLSKEAGDEVIIGASSKEQLEENLVDLEKGPLPEDVVQALDKAWEKTKGVAWNYFH